MTIRAQFIRREFDAEGVDTSCIRILPGASAIRTIGVINPRRGHRTLFYCLDGAPELDPAELKKDEVLAGNVIFVDGFQLAAATQAAAWGREAGRMVLMDAERTEPGNDVMAAHATHVIASHRFAESRVGAVRFPRGRAQALPQAGGEGSREGRRRDRRGEGQFLRDGGRRVPSAGIPRAQWWIPPDAATSSTARSRSACRKAGNCGAWRDSPPPSAH